MNAFLNTECNISFKRRRFRQFIIWDYQSSSNCRKQCNYNLLKVICMENIRSTILTYLNTNSIENLCFFVFAFVFFTISVFFHEHSRITGLQGKGECISLTPHYHFQPLHRHLNISRAITAESSPLHIVSTRTRTATFGSQAQVANR